MVFCRSIAVFLLLAALGLFAYEIAGTIASSSYTLVAGGELWVGIHANSLVGFQALIEKNISPWLWREVVLPILLAPAWAITGVPGVLFALLCHSRQNR